MTATEPQTKPSVTGTIQTFQLAQATWRDLNELRRLEAICFAQDAWPMIDLLAVLTWPKIVRLKAVVDGKMAGFIAGDPRGREGLGWIATLGVLPEYRRMGIAETLLTRCEEGLSLPRIRLSVRRSNAPALALYRKAGYTPVDVWRSYYAGGEDALVLEKKR